MRLAFLGPPGAGKGTLAELYAARHGLAHLSTGEMLRAAIAAGTPLGQQARPYVETGRLVPQALLGEVVAARLREVTAYILDGYPRTLEQAAFLEELPGFALDAVVFLAVPAEVAVRRLSARRVCPSCGAVHGREVGAGDACRRCGGELTVRADDDEKTVRRRYDVYVRETAAVVEHYRDAGKLREVDGTGEPETVLARLEAALAPLARGHDNG